MLAEPAAIASAPPSGLPPWCLSAFTVATSTTALGVSSPTRQQYDESVDEQLLPGRQSHAERGRPRGDGEGAQAPRRQPGGRRGGDRRRLGQHDPPSCDDPRVRAQRRRRRNRFPADTDEEVEQIREIALANGAVAAEANEAVVKGGEGAAALAEAVVKATEEPSDFAPVYPFDESIERKIEAIVTRVYGGDGILLQPAARKKIEEFERVGFDKLPICMAKRICRCRTTRRSRMPRPASPSRCATSAPTPARAGSSRSAVTCRRCRATVALPPPSPWTSTPKGRRLGSSEPG